MAPVIVGDLGMNERENKNNGNTQHRNVNSIVAAVAMATCREDGSRRVNNSSQGGREAEEMCRI